jgi:hypothetical protein
MIMNRTMLWCALAAALFAAAQQGAMALENVPKIDTDRMCRAAAAADAMSVREGSDACMQDEIAARDQLQREWKDFPPSDRAYCGRLSTMAGVGSYVQMLTCLEMEREVRILRQREQTGTTGSAR